MSVSGFYTKNGKVRPISKKKPHVGSFQNKVVHLGKPKKTLPPNVFAERERRKEETDKYVSGLGTLQSPSVSKHADPTDMGDPKGQNGPWKTSLGKKMDLAKSNKNILDPTNPKQVKLFRLHPDRFDVIDYDTPNRDADTIQIFRGLTAGLKVKSGENKYCEDYTLSHFNQSYTGLGKCWTGDITVARIYAIQGLTSIKGPYDLSYSDIKATENSQMKSPKTKGVQGIIFRYTARGHEITKYNPETYPYEQEAYFENVPPAKEKDSFDSKYLTLAERYKGIEIGFLMGRGRRRVEWHKVKPEHEHMKLSEIKDQNPTSTSIIEPVIIDKRKSSDHEIIHTPEGKLQGAVGKEVMKEMWAKRAKELAQIKTQKAYQKEQAKKTEKMWKTKVKNEPKKLMPKFDKYKLTVKHKNGNEETKYFSNYLEAKNYVRANLPKAFNFFDTDGDLIVAKSDSNWNPQNKPSSDALELGKYWEL